MALAASKKLSGKDAYCFFTCFPTDGIGTTAPGTNLAVNGSLAANNSPLSVVISKSAAWIVTYNSSIVGLTWNSFNGGDGATGTLKLGYLTLGSKLHMLLSGGGATNGALKVIKLVRASDNTVLINTNLGTVTGVNNNTNPTGAAIDTSAYSGETVYMQLEDNDVGSWGWIALFLNSVFVEP
ncbi:MAG: hypothetical protein FJ146_08045 [Deltaproteobacteria bacterium]|nr:hypothetical protein [Deltaproteobacteria bacterium]